MEYRIENGTVNGALEVYFESKPIQDIINGLKGLKMHWNNTKKCWWGFTTKSLLESLLNQEHTVSLGDGYMGAIRTDGNKSHLSLYGAALSKAIRQDLKMAHLDYKTSVKVHSYRGGQSITVSMYIDDLLTIDDFEIEEHEMFSCFYKYGWVSFGGNTYRLNQYEALSTGEREQFRINYAKANYDYYICDLNSYGVDINEHRIDESKIMNEKQKKNVHRIKAILDSFRFDNSNAQVDYYCTNFYYDIKLLSKRKENQ